MSKRVSTTSAASTANVAAAPDLRLSEERLKSLVADILTEAAAQGASASEVSASEDVGLNVNVRMN